MNKKLFKAALFAVAAFVSSIAAAQVSYVNTIATTPQTDDALVNPGGTARANDLKLGFGAATDAPADSEIIIRLPAGLNFTSAPEFTVLAQDPVAGLTLKDNTTFGDPTRGPSNVGVELFDTNADGGNDRALVTVSAAPNVGGGDSLTVSVRVTANSDATAGLKKASIIVNGGLAETVDLVEVTATTLTPITSSTGSSLVTRDQMAYAPIDVSTPTFVVVLPAGAENGDTVTLDVEGKVQWDVGTSTLTVTNIWSPVSVVPLTGTNLVNPVAGATSTVTLIVQGAPTGGFTDAVAATLQVNSAAITAGSTVGDYGLTAAGTAGVSGSAKLISVKENGSSAALATGAMLTSIVSGSTADQTLPAITITENFDGDAYTATTGTITITAGTGLTFGNTGTISITDGGGTLNAPAVTLTATNTVMLVDFTANAGGTLTTTIAGLQGTLAAGTEGSNVGVTVTGGLPSSPNSTFDVATGTAVGTVSVAGPTTLANVGPMAAGNTVDFTLTETTYGSITRAAYKEETTPTGTEITRAFFRVTPANADITGVIITATASYTAPGSDPTFGNAGVANNTCVVESVGSDAWICEVVTESTALLAPVTDTVTVRVTYTADGAVGDTISMSLDGNAGVTGSGDVANIVVATEASVSGAIPQVEIDNTDAQTLATFTITENFAGGLGTGTFRVIAPAGVVFANPASIVVPGGATPTASADTFAPNDTLLIQTPATPSLTITAEAIVADNVSGYLSFDIVDGNLDGDVDTGLTEESINLGYAVETIVPLDAGAAIALNAGFAAANDVTGGIGDYTVSSSSDATATAALDGSSVEVTGVAAGAATVTVTDELGATDAIAVTVSAVTIPPATNSAKGVGSRTGVAFGAGASSDGGTTFGTEFTTTDDVTIVATITVDATDVGSAGGIHVALKADTDSGTSFSFLNEDGNFEDWDITGLPGVHIDATALAATYTITVNDGMMAAGTYRIALAYSVGSEVIYTGKAIVITVTE